MSQGSIVDPGGPALGRGGDWRLMVWTVAGVKKAGCHQGQAIGQNRRL